MEKMDYVVWYGLLATIGALAVWFSVRTTRRSLRWVLAVIDLVVVVLVGATLHGDPKLRNPQVSIRSDGECSIVIADGETSFRFFPCTTDEVRDGLYVRGGQIRNRWVPFLKTRVELVSVPLGAP